MINQINEHTSPLQMADLLQELTNKIEAENDLHPTNYLEKDVKLLYSLAHKYYSIDNYQDAEIFFTRLVLARPCEKIYWRGLASSRQMLKNYSGALVAWGMCAAIDDTDLIYHIYGAECLYNLEEIEKAKAALKHVKTLITENHKGFSQYQKIKLAIEGGDENAMYPKNS